MSFDFQSLRGKMIEKYGSQAEFAIAMRVSENTLSLKMNNKVRFSSDDIVVIAKLLNISENDIGRYFFNQKVQQS